MSTDRRTVLGLSALTLPAVLAPGAEASPSTRTVRTTGRQEGTELVLLGTKGGPPPVGGERQGIASAVMVDGHGYLVDAGHGTYHRLFQAGIGRLDAVFVTHLHSDHIAELFSLPWLRHGGLNALPGPIRVFGPGRAGALPPARRGQDPELVSPGNPTPGTEDFMERSMEAAAYDLNLRMRDEAWPDLRSVLEVRDIPLPEVGADAVDVLYPDMEPFCVFEDDRVRVTATLVVHPPVFPAFAFRFDTADGSVVFSGDTAPSDNLIRLARGADYLVHEVIDLDWVARGGVPEGLLAHLAEAHTDVDAVGSVAQEAGVANLVLNHLVPADPSAVNDGQWRRRAQRGFEGRVHVGQDLMRFQL